MDENEKNFWLQYAGGIAGAAGGGIAGMGG